ncbi:MAG: hypothetical protein ACRDRX_04735 [Pseudonocardiaceae bacterium]
MVIQSAEDPYYCIAHRSVVSDEFPKFEIWMESEQREREFFAIAKNSRSGTPSKAKACRHTWHAWAASAKNITAVLSDPLLSVKKSRRGQVDTTRQPTARPLSPIARANPAEKAGIGVSGRFSGSQPSGCFIVPLLTTIQQPSSAPANVRIDLSISAI